MAVVKRSRQREAIKEFLMSRKDHPTAEVVYEFVSKDFPNISLGTVGIFLSLWIMEWLLRCLVRMVQYILMAM